MSNYMNEALEGFYAYKNICQIIKGVRDTCVKIQSIFTDKMIQSFLILGEFR